MEKSPSPTKARPTSSAMIRGIPRKVQRKPKKIFVGLNPFGSFPRQWTFLRRHQSSRDVSSRISDWPVGLAGRAHVSLCRDNRRWAAGEDAAGTVPQVLLEAIGFAFHWHAEMRLATESVGKRRTWILGRFGRGFHALKRGILCFTPKRLHERQDRRSRRVFECGHQRTTRQRQRQRRR